jgi:hypothetical protein
MAKESSKIKSLVAFGDYSRWLKKIKVRNILKGTE